MPFIFRLSLSWLVLMSFMLFLTSCSQEATGGGGEVMSPEETETSGVATIGEQTSGEGALTPAEATVGSHEITAMPAMGREEDPAQPPPENPPKGVRTFPATTNRSVEGPIAYKQEPPTHGDHAPTWQNCGFYSYPILNENAVHSLDHGAVWITFRPDLPEDQINVLRRLAREEYVLVSPYPGQPAPVIATAWRNQLRLKSARDPRLRQFINQFRVSETAPRSGNGCENGVGDPES